MHKDLCQSPSLITFEDFSSLLSEIDELIDAHKDSIAKYEDKLGVLLRGAGSQARKGMTAFNQEDSEVGASFEEDNLREGGGGGGESQQGWLVLEDEETNIKVATGSQNSARGKQTEALFKIIESLKARLVSLQKVRKLISNLPAKGFNPNQKIVVMFREGVPKQIIPSYEASKPVRKFKYSEQFDIHVLA
jgi:hypothetical protein